MSTSWRDYYRMHRDKLPECRCVQRMNARVQYHDTTCLYSKALLGMRQAWNESEAAIRESAAQEKKS